MAHVADDNTAHARTGGQEERENTHADEDVEQDTVTLEITPTRGVYARDQVEDYCGRGETLEGYSFLFFTINTYEEESRPQENSTGAQTGDTLQEESLNDDGVEDTNFEEHAAMRRRRSRGRPRNERVPYKRSHPRYSKAVRIVRSQGHNVLPSIVGRYFARSDDPSTRPFYCASMLALLKPWRRLLDLKNEGETWEEAFTSFLETSPRRIHDIIDGIQYYYSCSDAAKRDRERERERQQSQVETGQESVGRARNADAEVYEVEDLHDEDEVVSGTVRVPVTEALIKLEREKALQTGEYEHARKAMTVAKAVGIFENEEVAWDVTDMAAAQQGPDSAMQLSAWQNELQRNGDSVEDVIGRVEAGGVDTVLDVLPRQHIAGVNTEEVEEQLQSVDASHLLEDQRRVYDIVTSHLNALQLDPAPPQLLMHISGQGGTGKSMVIQTITDYFSAKGRRSALAKGAYTGIASSLIGGNTLHSLGVLSRGGNGPGKVKLQQQAAFWRKKEYLIVDEVSMISRKRFAEMDRNLCAFLGQGVNGIPFGGMNVIIVGDFHQFPPVTGGSKKALYMKHDLNMAHGDEVQGRKLYEAFDTVVKLWQQVHIEDEVWAHLLDRARHGLCHEADLLELRKLQLGHPDCPETDFTKDPWKDAVLVTPRHAVRELWNKAALRAHCKRLKAAILVSTAVDRVNGRQLTLTERYEVSKIRPRQSAESGCKLAYEVELAIGQKVMVTYNIQTELDIANGARGTIVDVVFEPGTAKTVPQCEERNAPIIEGVIAYVLVKMDRTSAVTLSGLQPGVVPIVPLTRKFTIEVKKNKRTITRRQIPIVGAYAFTDYRSQGQTIPRLIVDLAPPPTGKLTQFNAYVAMSRSKGRDSIRILRDFNSDLFTVHPSEALRQDDLEIERRDKRTKDWWKQVEALASVGV